MASNDRRHGYDGRKYVNETMSWEKDTLYLQEIKIISPEGLRDVLSMTTGTGARLCIGK